MDSTNFILIIRDFCSCLGSYGRIISSNFSYLELQKKVVQLILKLQLKKKANSPFILRRKGKKEPHWILDLSFYLASDSAFLQLQTQRKHFYYTTPWRLETHKRELRTSKGISGGSRPKNVNKNRTDRG